MKVTISRVDNAVYVDGVAHKVDCSPLHGLVQVVQWEGDAPDTGEGWADRGSGHIEFINDHKGAFISNQAISSLRDWTWVYDEWAKAHAAKIAMDEADKVSRADGAKALAHVRGVTAAKTTA